MVHEEYNKSDTARVNKITVIYYSDLYENRDHNYKALIVNTIRNRHKLKIIVWNRVYVQLRHPIRTQSL